MIVSALELMPIVSAALNRGQQVRLTVTGGSMRPFLQAGGIVELGPVYSPLTVGDVLLVRCGPERERYVLHRLVRATGDKLFMRGDAQEYSEGPFAREDVLGRVVKYYSNGRVYGFDSGLWHFLGQAWLVCFPLSVRLLRLTVRLSGRNESI